MDRLDGREGEKESYLILYHTYILKKHHWITCVYCDFYISVNYYGPNVLKS